MRQVPKPLTQAANALSQTLSARVTQQSSADWVEEVRVALAGLIVGLRQHRARDAEPGGLFAIVKSPHRETVPTLDRRVEGMKRQLTCLMDQAESLYLQVRAAAAHCRAHHARRIIHDGQVLLNDVETYLEAETKLLMDSLNTVVGVGD